MGGGVCGVGCVVWGVWCGVCGVGCVVWGVGCGVGLGSRGGMGERGMQSSKGHYSLHRIQLANGERLGWGESNTINMLMCVGQSLSRPRAVAYW